MKLQENTVYKCPECKSEDVSVSMYCHINANDPDEVEIDFESDIGSSHQWTCNNCGNDNFLPIARAKRKKRQ